MKATKFILPLAAAALFTACAAPAAEPASVQEIASPAAQGLAAYSDASLAPALQAYADARQVQLDLGQDRVAPLLMTAYKPNALQALPLQSDTLLAAAADRAGVQDGDSLPVGSSLYGYWADTSALTALLGEDAVTALQNATWAEWKSFIQTLAGWLQQPQAAQVTLNGTAYTLPEQRPAEISAQAVFAEPMEIAAGYTAALLAADGTYTAQALTGPVNGVYSAVTLENDYLAATGEKAVFCRAKMTDVLAAYGADACQGLSLIPFKCELEDSDLTTQEYNLTGLMNYPVLARAGWVTLNAQADADSLKEAESAVLWLYVSGDGETALTETLGVITPWNTASDKTALGAMQVQQAGTGILPAAAVDEATADALAENEAALRGSTAHTSAERSAFTKQAIAILSAYAQAQP